jgi:hypothetical protein
MGSGIAAQAGQVAQAEQGPGRSPLMVDAAHDGDRGLGQLLRFPQSAQQPRDRRPRAQRVPLVPSVPGGLGDRQRLVGPGCRLLHPPGVESDLGQQVQRGRRPELVPGRPARGQAGFGPGSGRGRIAGQGELSPRDQGRSPDPRRPVRAAQPVLAVHS